MLGSMLGFLLGMILFVLVIVGVIAGSSGKDVESIDSKSVLHLDLGLAIQERSSNNPLKYFSTSGSTRMPQGLDDILQCIHHAAKDEHISGIYLNVPAVGAGWATAEEIRRALLEFRKSGKWIIAYGEVFTKGGYYIASAADKVYLNPAGEILFNGLYSEVTFFKGALEKLGVEMQIIRHGKFKGAVEPFFLDKLSKENRAQIEVYVNGLWNHVLERVSASRGMTCEELKRIADGMLVRNADDAVTYKLADGKKYQDEVNSLIREKLGIKEKDKIKLVSLQKYRKTFESEGSGNDYIALIYAAGEINSGEGDENSIGSETLSKAIRESRLDEDIKAVVIRVNSPGGSALASEVIWREVALTKKIKPVIISMGDVAASGGYYISCGADSIFAQPNTITGSIGVFGLLPNTEKLMHDKLGITSDGVKAGKFSDLGKTDRALTPEEMDIMQHYVDQTYDLFISRVADGRRMQINAVDSIGQGRVWTGLDALKIGLVDRLGNLDDALKSAASMAKLKEYKLMTLPRLKDPFEEILSSLSGETRVSLQQELGEYYQWISLVKKVQNMKGVQARLPYDLNVH